MRNRTSEFTVGLFFGLDLIVAGVTDPAKVLGFLDLASLRDPSLALLMGGAVLVAMGACGWLETRKTARSLPHAA